jgi:hypothetical protein
MLGGAGEIMVAELAVDLYFASPVWRPDSGQPFAV